MFYNAHFLKCTIMPEVVTGGFGAVGALGGYLDHRAQFNEQKELMDKSYQQALDMWNLQNAYMTPKAQMQRFAEAGLNPDLIYGKLGDTSASMPSVSTPQVPTGVSATQGALAASQMRLQDSMARKNESETKSIDTQTDFYLKSFDTRLNLLTGNMKLQGFQADWINTMTEYQKQSFSLLNATTEYWKSMNVEESYRALIAEKEYENWDTRFSNIMNDIKARYRLNNSTARKIELEGRFLTETWAERKRSIILQNNLTQSQSSLNYAMRDYYNVESEFLKQKTLYMPFDFIDEISRSVNVFEHNEDGSIKTDKKGVPVPNSTYSGVKVGLEIGGEVMDMIGDVVGMVLPFKFLKSGFSVGGAKSAVNSLENGHMPSAKPRTSSSQSTGFRPSKEYTDLINKFNSMPPGKERDKLYWKIVNFKN